jgi:hypothetical protein
VTPESAVKGFSQKEVKIVFRFSLLQIIIITITIITIIINNNNNRHAYAGQTD